MARSITAIGAVMMTMAVCAHAQTIDLLENEDLSAFKPTRGWHYVARVTVLPGSDAFVSEGVGGILLNGDKKDRIPYLFTKEEFGDVRVEIEFTLPIGANAGVYLMGRYEIQIFDSYGVKVPKYSDLGGIYQRWDPKRKPPGYEGVPPKVNAAKAPGEWQRFEIVFRAPRFDAAGNKTENARFISVKVNGQLVHKDQQVTGPTRAAQFNDEAPKGPVVIQGDHGPIAIRSFTVTPLENL